MGGKDAERLDQVLYRLLQRRFPELEIRVQHDLEGVTIRFGGRTQSGKGRRFSPFVRFKMDAVSNQWVAYVPRPADRDGEGWVRTRIDGGVSATAQRYLEILSEVKIVGERKP